MLSLSESSTGSSAATLCVELVDVGDGLERDIIVDIQFLETGFSRASKWNNERSSLIS